MPCLPILERMSTGKLRRVGFVCVPNEPVAVEFNGRTYRFVWTAASGWIAVNLDGSGRLSRVPIGAWEAIERVERPDGQTRKEA